VVHSRTGGNPLFVTDLLGYLRDRGVIARQDGRWSLVRPVPEAMAETPESIRGLVRRKLDRLDPADRRLLTTASVQGAGFDSALAAGLPPARRTAVSRALADAVLALQNGQPGHAAAELALLYEAGREFGRAADLFHAAAQNAARVFAHQEAVRLARRGLGLLRG